MKTKTYEITTVSEAARLMRSIVMKSVADAELRKWIYSVFGASLSVGKLFAWVRENIVYTPDEKNPYNPDKKADFFQEPKHLIRTRKGDCDDTSLFVATVAKAYGLRPFIKFVKWHNEKDFSHVYVCIDFGNHYIALDVDPIVNSPGQEVFHQEERIFEL